MDLSIIIVNFNTFHLTCECINSITNHLQNIRFEIILVDNAPKENKRDAFMSTYPDIVYILSKENIGFGRANNLGIKIAKGKYLLLINSDTVVFDDSLQKCYQFMESDRARHIGLLGCKLLNEDYTYQTSFFPYLNDSLYNHFITNNILLFRISRAQEKYQETDQLQEVGDVSGAFMFMRREVVEKVGAFDPDFFLYSEETEWCRGRIAKHYKIVYYPCAKIIHIGGKSAPKKQMYIQMRLSQSLFWYKKGYVSYVSYIFLTYFNLLLNTLLLPFVNIKTREFIKYEWKCYFKLIPYFFREIPKYKRSCGSRKEPLIYKGARAIFFN